MANIAWQLLFGHLFGDFVFQNKWMAVNKSASHFKCLVHCLIYTACIALFAFTLNWQFLAIVFVTHFVIDRWSIADKWLDIINGRSLKDFVEHGHQSIPIEFHLTNYHVLRGGFTALVYAVVDNTLHLVINYYAYYYLVNSN